MIKKITCIYVQFDKFRVKLKDGLAEVSDRERMVNTIQYLKSAVMNRDLYKINHFMDDIFILCGREQACDTIFFDCLKYIDDNYSKKITLDDLGKAVNLSRQSIISKFRSNINTTPMKYLESVRIKQSINLLLNTNLSIGEISEECGFLNAYYYSNVFKKNIGISPLNYRKKFLI